MSNRLGAALAVFVLSASTGLALELRLPADCVLGEDCFLQQFPDMKIGEGAIDPFCSVSTYDGHDGVDLRVLSMKDITRGVPVVAAADGKVLRGRDGVDDKLIETEAERQSIMPRACGNGVVIAHGDRVETQYCHLRKGSVVVRPGQVVKAGDKIGDIGASGLVEFPHVHLTVRVNGRAVDPLTGRKVGEGCISNAGDAKPLFNASVLADIKPGEPTFLAIGLSGTVPKYGRLVVSGVPETAKSTDVVRVAWAWLANMKPGDKLEIVLTDPRGQAVAENVTDPLERTKAIYFTYVGKKGAPEPGTYKLDITVIRDGKPLIRESRDIDVE